MKNKPLLSPLLYLILFGTTFLFGFIENIKGVTYPLIKAEFGVSYEMQGVMVSLLSLSYMLFCLVGGIMLGRSGVKKTLAFGYILLIAGLTGALFMPRFWSAVGALILVFAGFGLFEVSVNALATQVFTSRAALLMSILHFFYGVGSSLSPRAAGGLAASLSWRMLYLLSIPLICVVFIPFIFTRFPRQGEKTLRADNKGKKRVDFFTALKTPMVWLFAVVLGLMIVVEMCSGNWAGLYFQDVYNLDPKISGAAFLSNFYILFTISRLVSGFIIEKAGYVRSLFVALLMAVFIFVLGFILGGKGVFVLPGLGFFAAIFWPTLMAVAMGYFREDAPVMTSAIIVIAGALNSGVQLLIGLTNRLTGPAWGYRSSLVYAFLAIAALIALVRCMRRPYKSAGIHT